MVQLEPIKHEYTNEQGIVYDSWSRIQQYYKEHFPADKAAVAYAKKNGFTPSYWKRQWKQKSEAALKRGHKIHNEKDEGLQGRGVDIHKGKPVPVRNAHLYGNTDLYSLPDGTYTELDIWNDSWKIAGRADKVVLYTQGEDRYADVIDYKTNGSIEFESYKSPLTGQHKMLLPPINHLMNTSFNLYTLQLSFYQYILETWGFLPGERTLIHIPHPFIGPAGEAIQPKDVPYQVPYRKSEIINILDDFPKKYRIDNQNRLRP